MTKAAHTPLPWFVSRALIGQKSESLRVVNGDGAVVALAKAARGNKQANGEFIVRACNSHYESLEALEAARPYVANVVEADGAEFNRRDLQKIDAAIARARGEGA